MWPNEEEPVECVIEGNHGWIVRLHILDQEKDWDVYFDQKVDAISWRDGVEQQVDGAANDPYQEYR